MLPLNYAGMVILGLIIIAVGVLWVYELQQICNGCHHIFGDRIQHDDHLITSLYIYLAIAAGPLGVYKQMKK